LSVSVATRSMSNHDNDPTGASAVVDRITMRGKTGAELPAIEPFGSAYG
jgi:hypothetical protein